MYQTPNSGLSRVHIERQVMTDRKEQQHRIEHRANVIRMAAAARKRQLDLKLARIIEMGD